MYAYTHSICANVYKHMYHKKTNNNKKGIIKVNTPSHLVAFSSVNGINEKNNDNNKKCKKV